MPCHPDRVRRNYENGDLVQIGNTGQAPKPPIVFHPHAISLIWPAINVALPPIEPQRTGEETV